MLKVDKVRMGESLRLNIGTAATLGTVTSVRESSLSSTCASPWSPSRARASRSAGG